MLSNYIRANISIANLSGEMLKSHSPDRIWTSVGISQYKNSSNSDAHLWAKTEVFPLQTSCLEDVKNHFVSLGTAM